MVVIALLNVGLAVVGALLGLALHGLPVLAPAWQAGLAPVSALAVGAVIAGGWRLLPGAVAAIFAACLALRPEAPLLAVAVAVCVGAAVVWTAIYARHAVGGKPAALILSLRGVLAFIGIAAAAFAAWVAALGALAEIVAAGASKAPEHFQAAILGWSLSHAVAVLIIAPPLLLAADGWPHIGRWTVARRLMMWALLAAAGWGIVAMGPAHAALAVAVLFLVLPVLLALAAWSPLEGAMALLVIGICACTSLATGIGAWGTGHGADGLALLAIPLAALAVTALPFAALMQERRAAAKALEASNADLEKRVAARTADVVASEGRLRHMLESSPVAVCVARPDGRLLFANDAFRALFGLTMGDTSGLNVIDFYERPEDRAARLDHLSLEGYARDQEYRYLRRDGSAVWVLEHCGLADFDGGPAVVAWMVDISARKLAAEALTRAQAELAAHRDQLAAEVAARTHDLQVARDAAEAANRAKTDFLANMGHELRTPLNAIIGFAQMIETGLLGQGEAAEAAYRDYAANIHRSGDHLLAVINDILDMAKFEKGILATADERVDLAACIDRVLAFTAPPPGVTAPAVVVEMPRRPPVLRGDRRQVEHMLVKLVANALRFTDPTGRVTLAARREATGGLTLSVSDTGIGMTAQEIEQALQPFVQVDTGLHRRYDGTGLGLPLVCAYAKLHDATVAVDSTPGHGTTVTVSLPPARVLEPYAVPPVPTAEMA